MTQRLTQNALTWEIVKGVFAAVWFGVLPTGIIFANLLGILMALGFEETWALRVSLRWGLAVLVAAVAYQVFGLVNRLRSATSYSVAN